MKHTSINGVEACPSNDPAAIAEHKDSLDHLRAHGHKRLLKALGDPSVFTAAGRVVPSRLARKLRVTPERATAMLESARELLQ
jgi:hypothetical protein